MLNRVLRTTHTHTQRPEQITYIALDELMHILILGWGVLRKGEKLLKLPEIQ